MAIIVIIEEWPEMIDATDIEWCWENMTSWILLYQIALHYPEKKGDFYAKLSSYLKKILLSIKNLERICKKEEIEHIFVLFIQKFCYNESIIN